MIIEIDILEVILYAIGTFTVGLLAGCAIESRFYKLMKGDLIVYLRKKLSKMDDQFVIAEDKNGIDVAYIAVDNYSGFNSVDLYFTGDDCSMTIGELLILHPGTKFYKLEKGDEI